MVRCETSNLPLDIRGDLGETRSFHQIREVNLTAQKTPGDDAQAQTAAKHPTKARRFRVLGKGEGDHCVFQIAGDGAQVPAGCLVPIPKAPRFTSGADAKRWAQQESGDMLAGMRVGIIHFLDIGNFNVINKPVVNVDWQPKVQVAGPPETAVAK